jgi:hypothetical protein
VPACSHAAASSAHLSGAKQAPDARPHRRLPKPKPTFHPIQPNYVNPDSGKLIESRESLCIQAPPVQKGEPRVMHGVGVYSLYFRQKWLKKTLCAGWILKWGSLSAVIWHAVTKKLFTEISGQAPPVRNFWLTFSLNCQGGGSTSRLKGLDYVHGLNFLRNIFDQ